MKEEEQDKKQRKRLVHASRLVDSAPQTWLPNEWMAECLPLRDRRFL